MASTNNKKNASSKKKTSQTSSQSKARTSSAKSKKGRLDTEAKIRQNISVIMIGIAVFLFFVAVIEGQGIWSWMHIKFISLFGLLTFVVPFYMVYATFVYSKGEAGRNAIPRTVGIGALIVFLCSVLHTVFNSADYFSGIEWAQQFADIWNSTVPVIKGGGILGALVGGTLAVFMGKAPALIIFIILFVCTFLILTGITLETIVSVVRKPVDKVGRMTGEAIERGAEKMEERRERIAAEKEEEKKKKFSPPASPTVSAEDDEDFEIEIAADDEEDESEEDVVIQFTPEEPEIPVVRLPEDEVSVVEEVIDKAAKERKRRTKSISKPDGDPVQEERAFPEEEEKTEDYILPSIECLEPPEKTAVADSTAETQIAAKKLISTLESFKIKAEISEITRGPSVTRYELVPDAGVRINKITNLADDIALRLAATSVRIEAPIPGKSAIGIEIPNSAKSTVTMRETIDTPQFRDSKSKLNVALGKDITGKVVCADLAKMPHLLVAGTTGSGKSVCLNAMIVSILYNATPEEVKLVMIDPKMVEFTMYNGIAHLEVPVVSNPRKAAGALGWAVGEMERRYAMFAESGTREIKGYNALCESRPDLKKIPQIVIFIDELADLMMVSPKEVEDSICRLAQKARAAGIHLVIATQRPSVDVITGLIKANIPSRIALSVSSPTDSRIILDAMGAEKLLGNGDMLFCPIGSSKSKRVQGCFISDKEVETVVDFVKSQSTTTYNEETIREIETKAAEAENAKKKASDDTDEGDWDPALEEAIDVVVSAGQASTTMLQKKLKLGYARASRVMDQLEEKGIVGPSEGAKPRAVLISKQQWYEMQALAQGGAPNIDDVFADDDSDDDDDDFFA